MFDLRYMYSATVTGVGAGFVNADGKTLRTIGNLPVKPGDTVYTDGRIAYGHVPVRAQAETVKKIKGIPYVCENGANNGVLSLTLKGTKIQKVDKYHDYHSKPSNWCYTWKGNFYTYWMQSDKPSSQKFDADDSSYYLDMRVSENTVYTAEYTNSDLPYQGLNARSVSATNNDTSFYAVNFYLSEAESYTPNNPEFYFNWFQPNYPTDGDGGRVYSNCGIRIRRNGQQINIIDLSAYQFALEGIKEYYAGQDIYNSKLKRYHYDAYVPRGGEMHYTDIDIMVIDIITQCLHFHFTDNNGNWEAIIFSMAEAMLNPHTIDVEGDEDEPEEVQSVFSFDIPMIYYVVRVKSNAEPEVLQSHIIVKKYNDNLVKKAKWVNAKEYPVEEVDQKNLNSFWINFDNCGYETDLFSIRNIQCNGVIKGIKGYISPFRYLVATNYHNINPYGGANNSWISYDLRNNYSEYVMSFPPPHIGFVSGTGLSGGYGVKRDLSIGRAYLTVDGNSYVGKMSMYPLGNKYVIAIYNSALLIIEKYSEWLSDIANYDYNMNLDVLSDIRKLKRPRTVNDLVTDVMNS